MNASAHLGTALGGIGMVSIGVIGIGIIGVGCGGAHGSPADGGAGDATGPVDAGATIDANDLQMDAGEDSGLAMAVDAGPPLPWEVTPIVVATAPAYADGIAGPIFPFDVLASDGRVYVVGEARAEIHWGDDTLAGGGFLLAIDAGTGALLYHRELGRGTSIDAIAAMGSDLVIVGSFVHPTSFAPSADAPIELTSSGGVDAFAARMSRDGEFRWARAIGSSLNDGLFDVHVGGRGIVAAGYLRADWSGCGDTLRTFPGVIDPMEGRLLGSQDGLIVELDDAGNCTFATVIGHPATDEFALRVAPTSDAIYVSGEGGGPLSFRATDGSEGSLGGDAGGWLIRMADDGAHDIWSVTASGSRGRGLGIADQELYFSFAATGGELRHGDEVITALESAVHVMRLSIADGSVATWSVGSGSVDTVNLAVSSAGVVVPANGADPSHVRVALLEGDALRSFRNDIGASYPYVVDADDRTVWMAGFSGQRAIALGDGEVPIELGPQGGLFLVRMDL